MLKKQILMLSAILFISISAFSQKAELKIADKAVKKKQYDAALSALNQAESLITNADAKSQAKYYYLKGMALYADGSSTADIDGVAKAFNQLISVENESGSSTYSTAAGDILNTLITTAAEDAQKTYQSAKENNDSAGYVKAGKGYERVYLLSPKDTSYLYNAALLMAIGKDFEQSNEKYKQLLDLGYTGVTTEYKAVNVANGQPQYYNSKKDMDRDVKIGIVENPSTTVTESKTNDMIKAIASNYGGLGDDDKALEFVEKARETNPNDYDLVIEEANIYFRKGDNAKFKEKLEEAIKLNPTNPNLYYNVGVMNMNLENAEEATINFKKAIELKSDYGDAYNNLGSIELDKAKPVQEEMDANASNFSKYDKIKAEKLLPIYREALKYYEKAYEFSDNDEALRNLLNSLYENLEMDKRIEE